MGDLATLPTFAALPTTYTHTDFNGVFAALTIAANAVTFSKFQAIAAKKLLGNSTGGSANMAEIAIADNIWSLLQAADYAAVRTALGLVIGTNVQAFHANLGELAGLTFAANKLPHCDSGGALALVDLTAAGLALLADANAAAQRTTLELGTAHSPQFSGLSLAHADGGALSLTDTDGTADNKVAQLKMEGTDLFLRLLNDDGSTRETAFRIDSNGVFIMGANVNFRLGTSYVNTPITPEGYLLIQDVNGNTYRVAAKLHS